MTKDETDGRADGQGGASGTADVVTGKAEKAPGGKPKEKADINPNGTTETSEEKGNAKPKSKHKKGPITVGVVAVVLVVAGAGFWVWHEQPSFCSAICHTPMDSYNETYDQDKGVEGVDKYGNLVTNTASMMAVSHREDAGTTCLDCHVPSLGEQISEGINWISGNYEVVETQTGNLVPTERSLSDLTEARGVASEQFCLNEACHTNDDGSVMTRDDLIAKTSNYSRNPHVEQHESVDCGECHKAHRASVNKCTQCHDDAPVPDGWITVAEEKKLNMGE